VDAVVASLREFGFRQPIVVDKHGVIVVGHTRWKAAQKLGIKEVPVHVAKDLTPEQAKAYRLADNQTATIAEWDKELLPLELADLQSVGLDLGLLGFGEDELAKHLQPVTECQCDPDDVPAPADAVFVRRHLRLSKNGFPASRGRSRCDTVTSCFKKHPALIARIRAESFG
jgi:ParB-like chromosome segregation protein Spo0J